MSFLNAKTFSIRWLTTLNTRSWLHSLPSNNLLSFLTSLGRYTPNSGQWILHLRFSQNRKVCTGDSWVELHANNLEYVGYIQTVFPDSTPRAMRDVGYYRRRRRHESRKYGARCGCRFAGSPASGTSPDGESEGHWIASQSCSQRGAKHPATVGHTVTENTSNDAGNSDTICCRDS